MGTVSAYENIGNQDQGISQVFTAAVPVKLAQAQLRRHGGDPSVKVVTLLKGLTNLFEDLSLQSRFLTKQKK